MRLVRIWVCEQFCVELRSVYIKCMWTRVRWVKEYLCEVSLCVVGGRLDEEVQSSLRI